MKRRRSRPMKFQ